MITHTQPRDEVFPGGPAADRMNFGIGWENNAILSTIGVLGGEGSLSGSKSMSRGTSIVFCSDIIQYITAASAPHYCRRCDAVDLCEIIIREAYFRYHYSVRWPLPSQMSHDRVAYQSPPPTPDVTISPPQTPTRHADRLPGMWSVF